MDNLPPPLKKLTSKCWIFAKWLKQDWWKSAGRIGWGGWALGGNCGQWEDRIVTQRRIEKWYWRFPLSCIVFFSSWDWQVCNFGDRVPAWLMEVQLPGNGLGNLTSTFVDCYNMDHQEEKEEAGEKTNKLPFCHFSNYLKIWIMRWCWVNMINGNFPHLHQAPRSWLVFVGLTWSGSPTHLVVHKRVGEPD